MSDAPLNMTILRHGNEKAYFIISAIFGGLIWLLALLSTMGLIVVWLLMIAFFLYVAEGFLRAQLFGNAVQVSPRQFPEIHAICQQCSMDMGLRSTPEVFVINSGGMINALAVKLLQRRYVLLYSNLVDLMSAKELGMVIAHELAHHAAGHTAFWRNLLIKPAFFIPFLGAAYSRACELTADRVAAAWLRDPAASKSALILLASGSLRFRKQLDLQAFREQERLVPPLFGFISTIFATHPRLTVRVEELDILFCNDPVAARPVDVAAAPAE